MKKIIKLSIICLIFLSINIFSGLLNGSTSLEIAEDSSTDQIQFELVSNTTLIEKAQKTVINEDIMFVLGINEIQILNISQGVPNSIINYTIFGCKDLAVKGNLGYAARNDGLSVINFTHICAPSLEWNIPEANRSQTIKIVGDLLYLVTNKLGLMIYNISSPETLYPRKITSFDNDNNYNSGLIYATDLVVQDDFAYVSTLHGFQIYNVSDLNSVQVVYDTLWYLSSGHGYFAKAITVNNNIVAVAYNFYGIHFFNCSNVSNPIFLGKYNVSFCNDIYERKTEFYIAHGLGLTVIHLNSSFQASEIGNLETNQLSNVIAKDVCDGYIYATDFYGPYLYTFDTSSSSGESNHGIPGYAAGLLLLSTGLMIFILLKRNRNL